MDLKKAQRLLTKIEAFLDNGNAQELSRLERDLMRSYVIQLYEAVTDDDEAIQDQEKPIEFVEYKMPKRDAGTKIEDSPARETEIPGKETPKPSFQDHGVEAPKEKPIEVEASSHHSQRTDPQAETKSFQYHVPEPIKETFQSPKSNLSSAEMNEALVKLFELPKSDELSGRLSHVPIASIESAMGLNERIFTLNELFGGDKVLFDATCLKLNHFNSFDEAKTMLMTGPARNYKWSEPQRIKMAEQFIRIVSRRYPKSVS